MDIHGQGEFQEAICRGKRNGKSSALLKDRDDWRALTGKWIMLCPLKRSCYTLLPRCVASARRCVWYGRSVVDFLGSSFRCDARNQPRCT